MNVNKILLLGTVAALIPCAALAQDQAAPQGSQPPAAREPLKSLGLTQDAWNVRLRERGASRTRPGYVRYLYSAEDVFPVRTREGMITTIKFPEGETITQAFSGDDAGFQVGIPSPNTVAIKALFPGVDTNLVAYSEEGKIYTFYVRSEGFNSRTISDFLVEVAMPGTGVREAGMVDEVRDLERAEGRSDALLAERVRDPYSTAPRPARHEDRDFAESTDFDPRTVVEDLAVFVPDNQVGGILPYRVFRDNRFTYIDYGPNASQMVEWPTVTMVVQGAESPVGFRTAGPGGRLIVIEALGEFVLRNGQRILCIKPRASVTPGRRDLVGYQQVIPTGMRVPADLPPGRPGPATTRPTTVVPANAVPPGVQAAANVPSATPVGPTPSVLAPLPLSANQQANPARTQAPALPVRTEPARIQTIDPGTAANPAPASQPASGIANLAPTLEREATRERGRPRVSGQAPLPQGPAPVVPAAGQAAPITASSGLTPITNAAQLSGYALDLGNGSQAELEDRWKSYRVQYYSHLNGKRVEYRDGPSGQRTLRLLPVSNMDEGIRICSAIAADGQPCNVVTNR